MSILKLNLPDPCKDKINTFFYKFNLPNSKAACMGFLNVMDKAYNPMGKVSHSILKTTKKNIEETFDSISEIRSYFKNEFSNGLETCMDLFWEDYNYYDEYYKGNVVVRFTSS